MTRSWSLRSLVILIAAAVAFGLLLDTRDGIEPPPSDVFAPAGTFQTRAAFCPPPFSQERGAQTAAIAADPGAPAAIRVEPDQRDSSRLADGRLLMHPVGNDPIDAVAYGAQLHAAALVRIDKPTSGAGAARCPRVVSDQWYFPAGSSSLGFDERLLIRNPFPDEAVVTVTFYTPTGRITKANLGEVAVPAGEWTFVKVNNFILRQPVLGVSVTADRGRVVAWRALFANPEQRPAGAYFGLGATFPSLEWYFPDGAVGTAIEEEITLLNPYRREAIVSIALATTKKRLQPPKLVEVRVPPRSVKAVSLPESLGGGDQSLGQVGAVVRSTNDVGVVAERTVWYAAGRSGVSSMIGSREAATAWLSLPAAVAPTDDSVVVLNPGTARATVKIVFLRQNGAPLEPESTSALAIPPGARRRFDLSALTGNQPAAVTVTSDEPIVVERLAESGNGDVVSLLGDVMRIEQ